MYSALFVRMTLPSAEGGLYGKGDHDRRGEGIGPHSVAWVWPRATG